MKIEKIGFGGGCHWCTEAVFQNLKGVAKVDQGWIASEKPHDSLSEAVIVHFNPHEIEQRVLIEIHLLTHSSASDHSMRGKYRSAIYTFSEKQHEQVASNLERLSENNNYVTKVLVFASFRESEETYQDYYTKNMGKPFCETYIEPKLQLLMREFNTVVRTNQ